MESEVTGKLKIYCNTCKFPTNHEIKSTHCQSYHEEHKEHGKRFVDYYEETEFLFLICCGCDSATLQEKWHCSGMHDDEGNEIHSYSYHPERKTIGGREVKRFFYLDKKLYGTYKEVVFAYQQGLGIVTAIGVRALLEGICVLEGIDDKAAWGLGRKIEELKKSSRIPDGIIDGLNGLKFIGDDAAHRLNAPDNITLGFSIDLLESLLTHMYEARIDLERKAEMVRVTHVASKNSNGGRE